MGIHDNYDENTVTFNATEIIIPLFRIGLAEYKDGWLVKMWEQFRDFKVVSYV